VPLIVYVKNVNVVTSGAPTDIGSITIPSWITRYGFSTGTTTTVSDSRSLVESGGPLTSGQFGIFTAAGGAGTQITQTTTNTFSSSVGGVIPFGAVTGVTTTSSTLHIRQTANAANAGVVSFYIMIFPLP
jgi:hypothetical protein